MPVDIAAAYRWALRGAEAGSAVCQFNAGIALLSGEGVAVDEAAGVAWLRRAADSGLAPAQWSLCVCHRDGKAGLRADDPAALQLLRSAAEGGYADARAELGKRLMLGQGMPPDSVAGVAMLRRAVEGGSLGGCVYLGDAHARGLGGLPVDVAAARALYERTAADGDSTVAVFARHKLHALPANHVALSQLPATIAPVCGLVSCGAALDAGTLSGLCAGCRALRYCGGDCQRAGWPAHRAACQAATAARKASAAAVPSSTAGPAVAPTAALLAQRAEVETWARMPLDALQQAAEAGEAAAQAALGGAYCDGVLGVTRDEAVGLGWLLKAAAGGMLPARLVLTVDALKAAQSPGANKIVLFAEAQAWGSPLAWAGDASAQVLVFIICASQALLRPEPDAKATWAEAGRWLRLAAGQGDAVALDRMALHAWDGHQPMGFAQDRVEARRLYAAADAAGIFEEDRATRPAGAPGSRA